MLLTYLKSTGLFVSRLYVCRSMIMAVALREIKSRYGGTTFGLIWSVVQPLATMVIYWFVFSVGLKIQNFVARGLEPNVFSIVEKSVP